MSNVYKVPVLAKLPNESSLKWFNSKEFLPVSSSDKESCFFDGVGVIDQILYSYHQSNSTDSLDFKKIQPIDINGALTVYFTDGFTSRIISDFVGSSFIYYYKKNGYELYSSCLISLKEVLTSFGIQLQKSIFFQVCENVFGNGCFGYTSYEDVYVLPENSMVIASKSNIKVVHEPIYKWLLNEDISYAECLERAKLGIASNIEAVINSNYKSKIAHITGGMDSRLVVAAIDSLSKIDDFELCCLGKHGDLDYDNAFLITGALGGKFSDRESYIVDGYPSTIEEKYQWEFEVTEGMLSNQSFHKGIRQNPDLIILSGGYGELLRRFYSVDSENIFSNQDNGQFAISIKIDENSFFKENVISQINDKISLFMEEAMLYGYSESQAYELFYMLQRNRYYVGNITKTASKFTSRFDPLYHPYVFKLSYLLEELGREHRVPLFDLMYSFSPMLTQLPFGTTQWSSDLLSSKNIKLKDFENDKKPMIFKVKKESTMENINWMPAISKESRALAKKMKASVWQVQIYPILQKKALEFINQSDNAVFDFYNQNKVIELLTKEHKSRVGIRRVVKFYSTLLWLK